MIQVNQDAPRHVGGLNVHDGSPDEFMVWLYETFVGASLIFTATKYM